MEETAEEEKNRGDTLGSLFGEHTSSDEDDEKEERLVLTEEEYHRKPVDGIALPLPPTLHLSLVSSRHSLWGHRLWNAALLLADLFDSGEIPTEGKAVLELGAGAGLPGLICALNRARKVVISDYANSTDQHLMVPIRRNIQRIQPDFMPEDTLHAVGHIWGHPVEDLLAPLHAQPPDSDSLGSFKERRKEVEAGSRQRTVEDAVDDAPQIRFDVVIMADLLFNRSQHSQLLETCDRCLANTEVATVWVSFSHHDPEKAELDMKFFTLARQKGFAATHIRTVQMQDLFVENDGLDALRNEVHLWRLNRQPEG